MADTGEANTGAPSLLGRLTMAELDNTGDFLRAPEPDAWGVLRAPFSAHIARLSAELAADAYRARLSPWLRAGWTDCSFVALGRVMPLTQDGESALAAMENQWRRQRARVLISGKRTMNDLLRTARQRDAADIDKTVVMAHAAPDGRVVIAIAFIGTTRRLLDWMTNFTFQQRDGMHQGFLSLARKFDARARDIPLPGLAGAAGEPYTLQDALEEARRPDSRFVFWVSGHSQGGALAQLYARVLMERGIDAARIVAYSLAAPTVAVCGGVADPKAYPVHNILSADDIVPRVGAQVRLGVDHVYYPDDAFRAAHYGVPEEGRAAFERAMFLLSGVQTTRDALTRGIAVARRVAETGDAAELEAFFFSMIPRLSLLRRVGMGTAEAARYAADKLAEQCERLYGAPPEEDECAQEVERLQVAIGEFGAEPMAAAARRALAAPHAVRAGKKSDFPAPAYVEIVRRRLGETRCGVWLPDAPPRRIWETP